MIILAILNIIYLVFMALTSFIDIPSMPPAVSETIGTAFEYFNNGLTILNAYTNLTFLSVLFSCVVAIDIGIGIYRFTMWVIRKVPMINIS